MAEWSKDHVAAIGSLNLNTLIFDKDVVKMETGRVHYGKVETTGWEGRRVGMWQAGTSKVVAPACVDKGPFGWPPRVSIERTDRMPVIWAR
jgi:hypothetical protein